MHNREHLQLTLLSCFICLAYCDGFSQFTRNHTELRFWTVGSEINARFGTNVHQALDRLRGNTSEFNKFMLTIAEQPLTKTQIVTKSGLAQSRVDYFITNLDSIKMIKKDNQARWATVLPVITDNQMKIIRKDLNPMAKSVAEYLKKEMHQLKTHYGGVKSTPDPPWEDITHLIIDKFIIDGTFHSSFNTLVQEKDIRELNRQHQRTTAAFFLEVGENFATFGCNWYVYTEGGAQREVYVLHGAVLNRYNIAMNRYRGDLHFSVTLFNITPEGGIGSLTYQEKEILKTLGWISKDRLLVPIVKAMTIKHLWPTIEKIGKDAADIAFGHFIEIADSYKRAPHSKFLERDDDYVQVCIHVLFGLIIEHLVNNGAVPRIPNPVPESFGVYFVIGKLF